MHADLLTTVSPTYAKEILGPEYGMGLDNHLRARHGRLIGILNGVDYDEWDPAIDPHIAERYSSEHHKFLIPNAEVLTRLPEAVDAMAEPMFGQDAVAFYLLAERVSQSVKVVQSGQGADEVFAGYFWYAQMWASREAPPERFSLHYVDRDHAEFLETVTDRRDRRQAGRRHVSILQRRRLGSRVDQKDLSGDRTTSLPA